MQLGILALGVEGGLRGSAIAEAELIVPLRRDLEHVPRDHPSFHEQGALRAMSALGH